MATATATATAINSIFSESNNKLYVENKPCNEIVHNWDKFLINSNILFNDLKREYQEIYFNDKSYDSQFEKLSDKEKYFYLEGKYATNCIDEKNSLTEVNQISRALNSAQSKNNYPTDSLRDLFDEVKQSITSGKNDYLDVLKNIFSNYMEFVKELREILSELSKSVKAGSKDGYINIDVNDLLNKLLALRTKAERPGFFSIWMYFSKDDDGRYYREINGEKIYYQNNIEADNAVRAVEKLLNEIKGVTSKKEDNSASVRPDIDFLFSVNIDLSGVDKLINYLNGMPQGSHDILQTEFDLLKKTLDAIEKGINTNLDELSKKYSSANSNYDNFVKIVSSTMNTLLEMAKGFLRF